MKNKAENTVLLRFNLQGLLLQDGHYYSVAPRKEADQPRRKRRSSFASSTPVPPGDSDDSDDGDSGHPLDDDDDGDDLHNRTHSSVRFESYLVQLPTPHRVKAEGGRWQKGATSLFQPAASELLKRAFVIYGLLNKPSSPPPFFSSTRRGEAPSSEHCGMLSLRCPISCRNSCCSCFCFILVDDAVLLRVFGDEREQRPWRT